MKKFRAPIPRWYKIKEIAPKDFIKCCEPIFNVIENKHESKTAEDPFIKCVLRGHNAMTDEDWERAEHVRLTQKALEMKMGDFHEELMGKFKGFETYPTGHSTGCDVGSKDGKIIFEIKNRHNTVKGSDGKYLIQRLEKLIDEGKRAIFVQVNCPGGKVSKFGSSGAVEIWNGKEAYAFISGRETFFNDLIKTINHVFSEFHTFKELKSAL